MKLLSNVVINVNPSNIPYSILAIKNIWRDRLNVNVEFFTHSTVPQLSDDVKNFMNRVKSIETLSSLPSLKLTIIWKDGRYSLFGDF